MQTRLLRLENEATFEPTDQFDFLESSIQDNDPKEGWRSQDQPCGFGYTVQRTHRHYCALLDLLQPVDSLDDVFTQPRKSSWWVQTQRRMLRLSNVCSRSSSCGLSPQNETCTAVIWVSITQSIKDRVGSQPAGCTGFDRPDFGCWRWISISFTCSYRSLAFSVHTSVISPTKQKI